MPSSTDIVSCLVAFSSLIVAWRTWESQKVTNLIYIDQLICNAINNYNEACKFKIEADLSSEQKFNLYNSYLNNVLEEFLNAYETSLWILSFGERRFFCD